MPLTKAQIIEIQEAAKFNFKKRVRDMEEKKQLEENVAKAVQAAKKVKPQESEKKGK